jgi:SAM-dependent methyltransferase
MQYEPIKKSVGGFFTGPVILRKILYALLDLLLLRAWHVKRTLKKLSHEMPPNASVLDAGAGFGQYTWRMAKMNPHWTVKGVDINSDHISDCTAFFSRTGLAARVSFETADLTKLNETELYNLVLSVDVMEHIEDDKTVFSAFCKALKDNGVLVISTPSDQGGSDVHDEHGESFIDEHVRDGYGIDDITSKLKAAGFRSVETHYTYGRPGGISWHLSMKYPIRMLNSSKALFIVLPFYYMLTFPVSLVLNFLDLYREHRTGTGLLVISRK